MKVEAVTCSDRRFVYLLVNSEGTAFKIGVSQNTHARISAIPVAIDYLRSFEISMETGAAYSVEKVLHYLFRNHHYSMPRGDGYTEWFDISVFDEVVRFLNDQRARLGVGDIQKLTLPRPEVARTRNAEDVAVEVKKARFLERMEAEAERDKANGLHNAKAYNNAKLALEEMNAEDVLVGVLFQSYDENSRRVSGRLILREPKFEVWLDRLTKLNVNGLNHLAGRGGVSMFGEWCHMSGDPIVAIDISPLKAYVANDGVLERWEYDDDSWPCFDAIRKLFLAYLLEPGSLRFDEMQHLCIEIEAKHAAYRARRANDD